jgi:hypothetical protein
VTELPDDVRGRQESQDIDISTVAGTTSSWLTATSMPINGFQPTSVSSNAG